MGQGSAKFTYELADLLISRGYESDYREAARLLKSVADEMPKAAARLGRLYMDGRGVPEKDYRTAYNWLKKVTQKFLIFVAKSLFPGKRG